MSTQSRSTLEWRGFCCIPSACDSLAEAFVKFQVSLQNMWKYYLYYVPLNKLLLPKVFLYTGRLTTLCKLSQRNVRKRLYLIYTNKLAVMYALRVAGEVYCAFVHLNHDWFRESSVNAKHVLSKPFHSTPLRTLCDNVNKDHWSREPCSSCTMLYLHVVELERATEAVYLGLVGVYMDMEITVKYRSRTIHMEENSTGATHTKLHLCCLVFLCFVLLGLLYYEVSTSPTSWQNGTACTHLCVDLI